MTRTDINAKPMRRRPSRRVSLRRLLILPVALLLVTALAVPALAASSNSEGLSNYKHPTTAKKEVKPSTHKEEVPSEVPTTTPVPAKQSSLPFTGFDLRWTVGFGLLLMGAGGWIIVAQRRQRRDGSRLS